MALQQQQIDEHCAPEEVLCTEDEVIHLLSFVDSTNVTGPDSLSAKMLKHTVTSITCIAT